MQRHDRSPISAARFDRRAVLRVGSLGLLGVRLADFLRARAAMAAANDPPPRAPAEAVILVWLEGGPSQVDTWDPKPSSGFRSIATRTPGLAISELLPRTAAHLDRLSLIRSMRTEENEHGRAAHYALTGHRPTPVMRFPGIGAMVTHEVPPRAGMPAHVLVPGYKGAGYEPLHKAAFLPAVCNPLVLADPNLEPFDVPDLVLPKTWTVERLEHRRSMLQIVDRQFRQQVERAENADYDRFAEQALTLLTSTRVREALDLSRETSQTRDAYGRTSFGQSLLLARRLVEAGSRFVTAAGHNLNGWDTHTNNDVRTKEVATGLDASLPVLLDDLRERGLLDSTIVLVMGEFGRTAQRNNKLGRDHWPHCWSLALGGGGLRGGQVVGQSDEQGAYVAQRPVAIGDLYATLYKQFGIDWTREYMTPIGRPIKIANAWNDVTGEPLVELV